MIQLTPHMQIFVAVESIDCRKGIDGLAAACRQKLSQDPFSGALFLFRNRARNTLKILIYDGQGFWLCTKRLSKGRLVQNDDTTARILSVRQQIKEDEEERKGTFTTAILATLADGVRIGLFFTGRKHAGENLNELLEERPKERAPPIQQCDALSRNVPKDHETQLANCLAHARRKFYELVELWPKIVTKIIGLFASVFVNDHDAPRILWSALRGIEKKVVLSWRS